MPRSACAGRGVRARGAREAEVAELDAAVVGEQHVLGLEVAVHDAGLVRGGEAGEDRVHDVDGLLGRELLVVLQQLAERDAGEVLHDEVRHVGVLALVEDVHDVRMREPRGERASCMNRVLNVCHRQVAVHHLEATRRSRRRSVARYTVAMPPRAIRERTWYRPSTRRPIIGSAGAVVTIRVYEVAHAPIH